jgi:N-acetylglucosamine repressor
MRKATQQQTKEHNRNLVLKTIFSRESVSRAETSRITGLTRTTVSDNVAELIDEGLVREVGVGCSLGGKSPILVAVVADSRYLIGLDLARTKFSGAIINLRGKICRMLELPAPNGDGQAALATAYELLDRLVRVPKKPLVGIGVGTPGLVNASQGVVVNAVNLGWKDLPLGQLLEHRYHLPVSVLNDSQAAAVGEHTFGDGHRPDGSLVVINVRHGIGAGIIINGQLFHGDGGGAGEIGHIVVVRDGGQPCRCGNVGCLETVAGTRAVVQRAKALAHSSPASPLAAAPDTITFEDVAQAFAVGDALARQLVQEVSRWMGMAISSLVGTLNIQNVVLTGDITRFGEPLLEAIRETLAQTMLTRLVQDTRVEFGHLGSNETILGASAPILNDYSLLFKRQHLRVKQLS